MTTDTPAPTTVVYHKADFDGIFCREIARHFLGDEVTYIGWDFGDAPLDQDLLGKPLMVMDLPVDQPFGLNFASDGWICRGGVGVQPIDRWDSGNIVWIDHHKSSIATHLTDIPGYRIDGVSACRLAWQWFLQKQRRSMGMLTLLPDKLEFVERRTQEPWAVRLAGEYDIWDRRDPDAGVFQFGLKSVPQLPWGELLADDATPTVNRLLQNGHVIQMYQQQYDADVVVARSFSVEWNGLRFLALNTAKCNSLAFAAAIMPEHDALMGFYYNGRKWMFSLYHAPGREHHDLSVIATVQGGGGHRGACGFSLSPAKLLGSPLGDALGLNTTPP